MGISVGHQNLDRCPELAVSEVLVAYGPFVGRFTVPCANCFGLVILMIPSVWRTRSRRVSGPR